MKQKYEEGSLQEQIRKDIIKSREHLKKIKNKLDYIKLPKDKITDLENELYQYNAGIVSLGWIGLKKKPTESNIKYLNDLLGRTIQLLREIKDE